MTSKFIAPGKQLLDMLKPRILATELLKKRVEGKIRDRKLILNQADFQILGSDNQGFSPSLLINSEGRTYLFNCGGGTQRLCYTNKIKLSNIENVFITRLDWDLVAGVYGLSLTLQDVGAPTIRLHSLDGLDKIFEPASKFITYNTGIKCYTRNIRQGDYNDFGLSVKPIPLDGASNSVSTDDEEDKESAAVKKFKRIPKLVSYFCSLPDLPGPLDPDKCRELKVPVGPQLAVLKSGKDITLEDGRLVKSVDVCGPKNAGLKFLVVDCVDESQVDLLLENDIINVYRKSTDPAVDMVVHFSPDTVVETEKYQKWMESFSDNCKHLLISNNGSKRLNFVDCYRMQYLMNKLDSDLFKPLYLPKYLEDIAKKEMLEVGDKLREDIIAEDAGERDVVSVVKGDLDELSHNNVLRLSSLDKIVIRPSKVVETIDPTIAMNILYQEAQLDPHFEEHLIHLKTLQDVLAKPKAHEPEVVFLGTGSALPSKLRNVSCILVNLQHPQETSIILDCGEDSYGQLYRYYGPEKIGLVLSRLKLIYISHHHADHHVGIINLLRARRKLTKEPVILLLPPNIANLLNYHNSNFEDLTDSYEIFQTKFMQITPHSSGQATSDSLKNDLLERADFLDDIVIVPVQHCVHSCAVVMKLKIGHPEMETFSLAYSGDARPSAQFASAGKGCDLLIHEATFDYRLTDEAIVKKHCTSTEAIQIGRDMEAKFNILTHFSQRLPKIPYFTNHFDEKVGFAFDNMSIKCPSQFGRLPIMKTILSNVFKKSLNSIDMKFYKQEMKQKAISNIIETKKAPVSE